MTIQINASNFESEVLKSEQPVLVDFWASWCQPCKMLNPTIEALESELAGKVKVAKIDIDANSPLAAKYGISAIPTVAIFMGGELVKKMVGLQNKTAYASAINDLVKIAPKS